MCVQISAHVHHLFSSHPSSFLFIYICFGRPSSIVYVQTQNKLFPCREFSYGGILCTIKTGVKSLMRSAPPLWKWKWNVKTNVEIFQLRQRSNISIECIGNRFELDRTDIETIHNQRRAKHGKSKKGGQFISIVWLELLSMSLSSQLNRSIGYKWCNYGRRHCQWAILM